MNQINENFENPVDKDFLKIVYFLSEFEEVEVDNDNDLLGAINLAESSVTKTLKLVLLYNQTSQHKLEFIQKSEREP